MRSRVSGLRTKPWPTIKDPSPAVIVLKTLGLRVGWGIQFQQPLFLAVMALVVTLFAYNLFGIFEIALPRWAGALAGGGSTPLGAQSARRQLGNHFVTGVFATLLATPCSAPFLGTALGFALARGPSEILMIFTALGIGLALPYLLIAANPRLIGWLPRPGGWMGLVNGELAVAEGQLQGALAGSVLRARGSQVAAGS